jgi:hypothetical protein
MNNLKEREDDKGERKWRAPGGSRQHNPPSESHSKKHFEQLLGDGGGKRKRRDVGHPGHRIVGLEWPMSSSSHDLS